jgi:SAM-dependent methyltransferase
MSDRSAICPLCGGAARAFQKVPDWVEGRRIFDLERCRACTLTFVHPIPSAAERLGLRGSEEHYYGLVDAHRAEFEREATRLLERIEEIRRPPGRLLDVGCGRGLLLAEAARRGWQASGVDASPQAAAAVRARGLDVVESDFLTAPLGDRRFDVVLLQQVVEHSTEPMALVTRARDLLREEGLLFVGTPNACGLLARALRESFSYWIPPEHVFHYGPRSLRLLLERGGFEVVRLSTWFLESPLADDLRDIGRHHPWLRLLPRRAVRRGLRALRPMLERRGEGTILEAFARPASHGRP